MFWSALAAITGVVTLVIGLLGYVFYHQLESIKQRIELSGSYSDALMDGKIAEAIDQHRLEITQVVREHINLAIEAKLAALANDITARINGTYMRTPEALARFADLQRQIEHLK
jgi:hypothetical protein